MPKAYYTSKQPKTANSRNKWQPRTAVAYGHALPKTAPTERGPPDHPSTYAQSPDKFHR